MMSACPASSSCRTALNIIQGPITPTWIRSTASNEIPDECIDCGVCEPECPVDAIKPDTEPGVEKWLTVNAEYAKSWPNITAKKEPPPDAKEWEGVANKFEGQFSPNPGSGD